MKEIHKEMPWLEGKRGWLKNPLRKQRREQPQTLTDTDVKALIQQIEDLEFYGMCGEEPHNTLLKQRDECLISLAWTFFKRGSENLGVRLSQVRYNDRTLSVTFHLRKKTRGFKMCPRGLCITENSVKAQTCRTCEMDLSNVDITRKLPPAVTKRKTRSFPFCKYVIEWAETLRKMKCPSDSYFIPRFDLLSKRFMFDKNITVQRLDQILQRLDITMFSHSFRYGASEKLMSREYGYTPHELAEIGDWETSFMPELYAKRKGLTPTLKRFEEDDKVSE